MANTKISELPQLVGAPSDSDFIPIVDNSELVTKRILVSDLLINVPESGIDSATAQSIASAEIASTVDSAYVQSRQIVYGDGDVTALVDSAYVQSRQIVYGDADVTSLVDSNYVQTRIPLSGGYAINYDSSTGTISFDQSTDLIVNSLTTIDSLVVGGDLQVNGTTTTVNAVNLEVTDNMIYMNAGESAGSPVAFIDVGFAANVNETGSYAHTGFFRDASDNGTWKLFDGYQPEPDSAVQINTGHPSFSLASLQVDAMTATSYAGDGSQLTGMFDSADVVGIVDSDFVNARVDFDAISFSQEETFTVGAGGNFANIEQVQAFLDQRRLSRGSDSSTARNGNVKITIEFLAGTHEMPINGYWNIENLGYYLIVKGQGSATTSIIRNPLKTGTQQLVINNSHVIIDAITLNLQENYAINCSWGAQLYLGAQASDVAFVGGIVLDHGSVLQTYQAIDFGNYDITVDNGSFARFAGVTCDDFWVYDSKVYCDGPITVADDFYVRRSSVYVVDDLILNGTTSVLGVERQSSLTVAGQVRATNTCTLQVRNNSHFLLGDMNSVDFVNDIEVLHNSSFYCEGGVYSKNDCMVGESSKLYAGYDLEVGQSFQCYRHSSVYVHNRMIVTNPNLPILIVDDSKVFVGSSFTSSSTTQEISLYSKGHLHVATDATVLGDIDLDDHSVLFVDDTLTIGSAVTPAPIFVNINSSKLECQDLVYTTSSTLLDGVLVATDNSTIIAESTVTFNTTATTSTVRDLILVERSSQLASYNNFTWNNTGNATNVNLFKVRRNGTVVVEDYLITTSDQASNKLFNLLNPSNVKVSGITSTMTDTVQGVQRNELLASVHYSVGDSAEVLPFVLKSLNYATLDSAPVSANDKIVVADGVSWDPASKGTGTPYPAFYDGSAWKDMTAEGGGLDSAGIISLVDSAYVQLRQDRIQNLYDSGTGIRITGSLVIDSDISVAGYQFTGLVGTPSNGAFITWDSDLDVMTFTSVDSNNAAITALIDSDYIQSRVTLNGSGIDSATAVSIANAEILSVVDSAYVQLRQDRLHNLRDSGTGVVVTGNLHVESDLTVAGVATISGFDIGIQGDSVTGIGNIGIGEDVLINLTSGSENLVLGYLSGSAISTGSNNILLGFNVQTTDSAASHEIVLGNDSNNRLRIPGLGLDTNDATNGQVLSWDSATSQFSWLTIPASGIDSAGVVSLVDSAYVQSRVTLDGVGLDSAGVITVLNDTTVGQFTDTLSTTIATIMGVGAVGLDIDNTVPNFTVAIGAYALDVASTGTANTAIGRLAGGSITTGSQNVAVGHESLDNTLNSITDNVSIGVTSAQGLAGSRNILVGTEAGYQAGITNNSVLIGYQAGKNVAGTGGGQNNNIVIGYQAAISAQNVSNEITLGNASIDRLRIPGLGLDTNDATDGQSLTWDSATGNFAWSTITGGSGGGTSTAGTRAFTAAESLVAGDVVVLNTDGTVAKVSSSGPTLGTAQALLSSTDILLSRYALAAQYISANTIVFAYITAGGTGQLALVAATQSGDTFTVGAPQSVNANTASANGGVGLATNGTNFVVSYYDNSSTGCQVAAGTVSGTTITVGTEVNVITASVENTDIAYSPVDGEYLVVATGQSYGGILRRLTVSGTTITLQGTQGALNAASVPEFARIVYVPAQDVFVVAYTDGNTSLEMQAVSISGGTITLGTALTGIAFATTEMKELDLTVIGSEVICTFVATGAPESISYVTVGVSGTTLSLNKSQTSIMSITASVEGQQTLEYDSDNQALIFVWDNYAPTQQAKLMRATFASSTLTFGPEILLNNDDQSLVVPATTYNPDDQRIVVQYFANTTNTVEVISVNAGLVSNKEKFVGIAAENIDSAATGNITIFGGVNEAVSGLTIGSNYYVSDEGALTTAVNDLGIVGRALDSDAIVIKL